MAGGELIKAVDGRIVDSLGPGLECPGLLLKLMEYGSTFYLSYF